MELLEMAPRPWVATRLTLDVIPILLTAHAQISPKYQTAKEKQQLITRYCG
jgi:hypothetical protein